MTWDLPRTQTSLSLSLDENVRAKEGGKETMGETALRLPSVPFPWSLAVHHQSLASTLRKTKRLRRRLTWDYAAIKCWMHVGSVLSPENLILKNSFFNYGMFQRFTRITNSLTIFTKQYMLIASAKNLKRYLQFNPDELQWLSGARKSSVTCCQFNREGEWTHNLRRLHILRLELFQ